MKRLTRHLVVCINSFNDPFYVGEAQRLVRQIHMELSYGGIKYVVFCAFGGCPEARVESFDLDGKKTIYSCTRKNLSDHNAFPCLKQAERLLPRAATVVFLHDTCSVCPGAFRRQMVKLSRLDVQKWTFAHSLGLYNMGVCPVAEALAIADQWEPVGTLPKAASIALEHSRTGIEVEGHFVAALRSRSDESLNAVCNTSDGVDGSDMHSITAVQLGSSPKPRHVVYMGSLGVYKFSHTPGPYLLPIWVGPYAPSSREEFDALGKNAHVKANEWVRALLPASWRLITTEDGGAAA